VAGAAWAAGVPAGRFEVVADRKWAANHRPGGFRRQPRAPRERGRGGNRPPDGGQETPPASPKPARTLQHRVRPAKSSKLGRRHPPALIEPGFRAGPGSTTMPSGEKRGQAVAGLGRVGAGARKARRSRGPRTWRDGARRPLAASQGRHPVRVTSSGFRVRGPPTARTHVRDAVQRGPGQGPALCSTRWGPGKE